MMFEQGYMAVPKGVLAWIEVVNDNLRDTRYQSNEDDIRAMCDDRLVHAP